MPSGNGLEHYRQLLREELERTLASSVSLVAQSRSVSAARDDSNADDEHDPEGTTIASELSQMSVLAKDAERRSNDIRAALSRLDGGTYGRCAACGQPIAEGRLEARPWTEFCIDHATGSWLY